MCLTITKKTMPCNIYFVGIVFYFQDFLFCDCICCSDVGGDC